MIWYVRIMLQRIIILAYAIRQDVTQANSSTRGKMKIYTNCIGNFDITRKRILMTKLRKCLMYSNVYI